MQPFRTVSLAAVVTVALGTTVLTATPALAAPSTASSVGAPTPAPTPAPVVPEPSASALGQLSGHSSNQRHVTITGTGFTGVDGVGGLAAVLVGVGPAARLVPSEAASDLVVRNDTTATFLMGAAPSFQPGSVSIALRSTDGTIVPTTLAFTYTTTNRLDKQMAYAGAHWTLNSSARFGYIKDNDCADFASQTLLARGWKPSSQWYDEGPAAKTKLPMASAAWVSSTAMSSWLRTRPDLAKHLTYAQADRDQVTVGDIVQFNWDVKAYPGVWQHTAIVSKIVTLPNGHHDFYYAAHTNNQIFGGTTGMLAAGNKNLRIQFWHLKK